MCYVAYIAAQAAGARFRILAEASTLAPNTRALHSMLGSVLSPGTIAVVQARPVVRACTSAS